MMTIYTALLWIDNSHIHSFIKYQPAEELEHKNKNRILLVLIVKMNCTAEPRGGPVQLLLLLLCGRVINVIIINILQRRC